MSHLITGYLTKESPLRRAFPNGMLPLASPNPGAGLLDGSVEAEAIYMLSVRACSLEQLETLATMMHENGQGSLVETRGHLRTNDKFPIRAKHLSAAGISTRAFI